MADIGKNAENWQKGFIVCCPRTSNWDKCRNRRARTNVEIGVLWAKAVQLWEAPHWKDVVFSETTASLAHKTGGNLPTLYQPKFKGSNSAMIWGCIDYNGVGNWLSVIIV